jgi:16S rRNA processing protein RimM
MDPFEAYYYLGRIIRPHGFDGKVNVFIDTDDPDYYRELDHVFLDLNNTPVPYFIESIILKGQKATIKFQEVDDQEAAALLIQKAMYLPLDSLPPLSGNKFYYHEIEGFTAIDKTFGEIGVIQGVLEYPNQAVLQVKAGEKEVLIPVSHDIILKVDRSSRVIEVQSPEGLLDIYLG